MEQKITCFLPAAEAADLKQTIQELRNVEMVDDIFVFTTNESENTNLPSGVRGISVTAINSTEMVKEMAVRGGSGDYILLYTKS
ncbi:MAG TPA: hypothetical protein VJ946_11090, partial [Bacteroidales bacterium]|nr:hypothetical protein [Bacteroidales bacterium]